MPRVRKILKNPPKSKRNYYVVDACFLSDKYVPISSAKTVDERSRIRCVHQWWKEIDRQVDDERARVYVPDLCIAETFKVLAKKYYQGKAFSNSAGYKAAREKLIKDVTTSPKVLKSQKRIIKYHDLPASRDVIIAVDRFYEQFLKNKKNVGIIDLIVVASAKYLMDFFDLPKSQIHIVTMDRKLWQGVKKIAELPNAYDPYEYPDSFDRVFR